MRVPLPDSATVDAGSSSCGTGSSSPWLVAVFGPGHALGLSFSTNGSLYSVANLTLQYNLSDTSTFPEANSSGENIYCKKLSGSEHIQLACVSNNFHARFNFYKVGMKILNISL